MNELLCADDFDLINEAIKGHKNKFLKWKEAFESKGLKFSFGETNVIVSGSITKDGMSISKVDPCGICSLRAKG